MRPVRIAVAASALAVLIAAVPLEAAASSVPPRQPVPSRLHPVPAPAPPPRVAGTLTTIDHPVTDGVSSFDSGTRVDSRIALTFDADMTTAMLQQLDRGLVASWYNRDVLDVLHQEQIPATIFLTGLWTLKYPEEARTLANDPLIELGNHTYDHAAFRVPCYGMTPARDRKAEVEQAQEVIKATTGVEPRLLRFPGDCYDNTDVQLARDEGLIVVSGDVRAGDGFNRSAAAIAAHVLTHLQPGSIVILHLQGGPNAPMTAPALRMIIQGARAKGLGFATVSELIDLSRKHAESDEATLLARVAELLVDYSSGEEPLPDSPTF